MTPTWLIEADVFGESAEPLRREVRRQGMAHATVDYRPARPPPDNIVGCPMLPPDACVVFWGTLPLLRQIQLHRDWVPGGWCSLKHLECATYYAYFGRYLLNDDYALLPGVEALRMQDRVFEIFGLDGEVFVRPSSVLKLFSGRVVGYNDFRDATAPARYDPRSFVVISRPKPIEREWRLVIADDEVVAGSLYRDAGVNKTESGSPAEVANFAAKMLREVPWRPDPIFMMDVCHTAGRMRLVEMNSFSCSGMYDCDVAAVVSAASRIAVREWERKTNETTADSP